MSTRQQYSAAGAGAVPRSPAHLLGALVSALATLAACDGAKSPTATQAHDAPAAAVSDAVISVAAALQLPINQSGSTALATPLFKLTQTGKGNAGYFYINNVNNANPVLTAYTNGSGPALQGVAFGNGVALDGRTGGTGPALRANQSGASGSIAVFQSNGVNRARIDKMGKGYFNGGTQSSGADVAEAFAVEGPVRDYGPGDVLVISARSDRTVERSAEPYSARVVGVYATKPGVLLTERGIDERLDGLVPLGVVGVIPTKVSAENGPIARGDPLVTSGTPGHAMRGEAVTVRGMRVYPNGAILGKALAPFAGPGTGTIPVLVNVQ